MGDFGNFIVHSTITSVNVILHYYGIGHVLITAVVN